MAAFLGLVFLGHALVFLATPNAVEVQLLAFPRLCSQVLPVAVLGLALAARREGSPGQWPFGPGAPPA